MGNIQHFNTVGIEDVSIESFSNAVDKGKIRELPIHMDLPIIPNVKAGGLAVIHGLSAIQERWQGRLRRSRFDWQEFGEFVNQGAPELLIEPLIGIVPFADGDGGGHGL